MARQWQDFPLHQLGFAPDLPPYTPGIFTSSVGCYPTQRGVRTLPTPIALTNSLAAAPRGVFAEKGPDGAWRLYAATTTHIYRAASPFTSWAEYDNSQTFTMSGGFWSFAMRGNDVYATDLTDAVQKSTAAGQFAALTATAGSVPKASFVVVIQPGGLAWFVMLLGLSTDPAGWAASGVGDDGDWGFDVATLGASGTLGATNGAITAAAPLRGGVLAFKASSLIFGSFVGAPFVWDFSQVISRQVGTEAPQSLVQLGDTIVFQGNDNFYMTDGYSLQEIPNGLRSWYFGTALDLANINNVWGRYDAVRDTVFWHYPVAGGDGTPTHWIAWHRRGGRWTHGTQSIYAPYPKAIPISATAIATGAIVQTSVRLHYFGSSASTSDGASFLTWDVGQQDGLSAFLGAKPHWALYPAFSQSLDVQFHTSAGVPPTLRTNISSPDQNGYFDAVSVARWHNLGLSWFGDAEVDALGLATDYAGEQ